VYDIFLSYSQKDRDWITPLVEALSAEGYGVWWDHEILPGESFDESIERKLQEVHCVLVVWSKQAVQSRYVRAEAAWALDHKKAVSACKDERLELPIKYYNVETISLFGWDGSRQAAAYGRLLDAIGARVGARGTGGAETEGTAPGNRSARWLPVAFLAVGFTVTALVQPSLDSGVSLPQMVAIPAGTFRMGCVSGRSCNDDESPLHQVTFSESFAIGKHEVTFAEYDRFAKATNRPLPDDEGWGRGRRPVINVTWTDARDYADWLSEQTGKRYRLPSEAEWEYAVRAGTQTPFSTGACIDTDDANFHGRRVSEDCPRPGHYRAQTVAAGSLPANPWGLHEMHGNVFEWVEDCWHGNYDGAPVDGAAWLDSKGGDCDQRVMRGGAYISWWTYLRSADRHAYLKNTRWDTVGFRLAADL
jgi:formylglycine-generating enzyme required for sulfatase activity